MSEHRMGVNPLFLREDELRRGLEMMFVAWRDFYGLGDPSLDERGLGRAHFRVIYFVGRYPGASVGKILAVLGVTKQSLSRVLNQLVTDGYVRQRQGTTDRRQRLLELTEKGVELEREITERLRRRLAAAFRQAGAEAVDGFRLVLLGMMHDGSRQHFLGPARGPAPAPTQPPDRTVANLPEPAQ